MTSRRMFYWACPLPLLFFGLAWWHVSRFEGWGQWAAAPMLVLPTASSLLVCSWGGMLVLQEHGARRPVTKLVLGVLLGGSVVVIALVRWVYIEMTRGV